MDLRAVQASRESASQMKQAEIQKQRMLKKWCILVHARKIYAKLFARQLVLIE